MTIFGRRLAERQPDPAGRRWLFVPYDQVSDAIGPLSREEPRRLGIVVVENPWKPARRPYHKQKLALILANLRHFTLEQAARGVAVRHVVADGPYRTALEPLARDLGPLRAMEPAERELRADLQPLVDAGGLEIIPHEGWLTTGEQFHASQPGGPPWRMEAFYRSVRRESGILMQGGRPQGGKFSFDVANRLAWKGSPPAPTPPTFAPDPVTEEVGQLIEQRFAPYPGCLDLTTLPATAADAEAQWTWARQACLPAFGPYEDAMSARASGLFHTRISALLNILRLLPARVVGEVAALDLPLQSKEGFIRQVLGWREFVRHVHRETDGLRRLPTGPPPIMPGPDDGSYRRWAGTPWTQDIRAGDPDGGAAPSALDSDAGLPPAFWGVPSGLACLDRVVADVWREGYSHHITRLMVLANIASLLDVSPRELTDWFWAAYTDAYDWVVEPNVLGMGTFAVGDLMTTKPYISGAAYIDRMSDFCERCAFDPRATCPLTPLYWAFLARHERRLQGNPRLGIPLQALKRRDPGRRRSDRTLFGRLRERLLAGETLTPEFLSAGRSRTAHGKAGDR